MYKNEVTLTNFEKISKLEHLSLDLVRPPLGPIKLNLRNVIFSQLHNVRMCHTSEVTSQISTSLVPTSTTYCNTRKAFERMMVDKGEAIYYLLTAQFCTVGMPMKLR